MNPIVAKVTNDIIERSKAQRQVRLERTWTHAVRPKGRLQDVVGQPSHSEKK